MSDGNSEQDPKKPRDGFGLDKPTGKFAREKGERPEVEKSGRIQRPESSYDDVEFKAMGWKGIDEEEEVDDDPDVNFASKYEREEDEMDMTPMVDVTFLLLIFFMVTASFTLQKSVEQPPPNIDEPSTQLNEEQEDEDQYVEVIIDQTNTYYVTSKDAEEVEAPSAREMRARMKDAKLSTSARKLIITAHIESEHDKVITAWDAGTNIGMGAIEIRTTDVDY